MQAKRIHLFSKTVITLSLVATLLICFGGCGSEIAQEETASPSSAGQSPETPTATMAEVTELSVVDRFIELYNISSANPIEELIDMDIHGEDYKTEFRLNSFKNAVGMKGTVSGGTIEVVNYGVWENNQIRIYAFIDTYETAIELYTNVVHVLDNTISDDEITEQYDGFEYTNSANIFLGTAGYISGSIDTSYADGVIDGYTVLIDCSKLNFMQ